jgi:tetratricopeptide (TPR) repeat protein
MVTGFAFRELAAFSNLWMLVFSLLPLPLDGSGPGLINDGLQLLSIPFRSAKKIRKLLLTPVILEAQDLIDSNDLDNGQRLLESALARGMDPMLLRMMLGAIQLERSQLAEARATWVELLESKPDEKDLGVMLQNNIAWVNYLARDEARRREADEYSVAAYVRFPSLDFTQSTRGAVLLWLGHTDAAIRLIKKAYALSGRPKARAMCACNLALAYAKINEFNEARTWLKRARDNDGRCRLLAEAEVAVRAERTRDASSLASEVASGSRR